MEFVSENNLKYNFYKELLSFFPIESTIIYLLFVIWYPSDCSQIKFGGFTIIYCLLIVNNAGFIIIRFLNKNNVYFISSLIPRVFFSQWIFISITILRAKPLKCLDYWSQELGLINLTLSILGTSIYAYYLNKRYSETENLV